MTYLASYRKLVGLREGVAQLSPEMRGALKRVVGSSEGSFRILKSVALKLAKLKLVDVLHGSEYRRSEFGRETGPVFVTVMATEAGKKALRRQTELMPSEE